MQLREGGTGEQITVRRDLASGEVTRHVGQFQWTLRGARLEISFPCPDVALASGLAPPNLSGLVSNAEWVLDGAAGYARPVAFTRVPQM